MTTETQKLYTFSIPEIKEVLGVDKDLPSHFLIDPMGRTVIKAFVHSSPIIDRLRMIKDEEEIKIMKDWQ